MERWAGGIAHEINAITRSFDFIIHVVRIRYLREDTIFDQVRACHIALVVEN